MYVPSDNNERSARDPIGWTVGVRLPRQGIQFTGVVASCTGEDVVIESTGAGLRVKQTKMRLIQGDADRIRWLFPPGIRHFGASAETRALKKPCVENDRSSSTRKVTKLLEPVKLARKKVAESLAQSAVDIAPQFGPQAVGWKIEIFEHGVWRTGIVEHFDVATGEYRVRNSNSDARDDGDCEVKNVDLSLEHVRWIESVSHLKDSAPIFDARNVTKSCPTDDVWVQCDKCAKWRRIPNSLSALFCEGKRWICEITPYTRSKCEHPQELENDEIDRLVAAKANDGNVGNDSVVVIVAEVPRRLKKRRKTVAST